MYVCMIVQLVIETVEEKLLIIIAQSLVCGCLLLLLLVHKNDPVIMSGSILTDLM